MNQFKLSVIFIAAIISIGLYSCSQSERNKGGPFINHHKWMIYGGGIFETIKDHPKKITQYAYANLNDTLINSTGTGYDTTVYEFDAAGNLILKDVKTWLRGFYTTTYTYNEDGEQMLHRQGYVGEKTNIHETKMERLEDGAFRGVTTENGADWHTDNIRFSKTGDTVTNNIKYNNSQRTIKKYFTNGRFIKQEFIEKEVVTETRNYYYSANGNLQGVEETSPGHNSKILCSNYEKNCPREVLIYKDGKLETTQLYQYEFDSHGNWTRKLVMYSGRQPVGVVSPEGGHRPAANGRFYVLYVRNIQY